MRNEYRAYLQQCKEQESLYHQIALSLGLPDSVLYLLYTIAEQGDRKNPGRHTQPDAGRIGLRLFFGLHPLSAQSSRSSPPWGDTAE